MDKKVQRSSGSLKISNDVIARISELAATEIGGVAANGQKLLVPEMPVSIAQKFLSPIRIKLAGDAAAIDVDIIVEQGHKAVRVAEAVQASVKSAVQNMTGIAVGKVNVKIVGIRIKPEEQQQ